MFSMDGEGEEARHQSDAGHEVIAAAKSTWQF